MFVSIHSKFNGIFRWWLTYVRYTNDTGFVWCWTHTLWTSTNKIEKKTWKKLKTKEKIILVKQVDDKDSVMSLQALNDQSQL